MRVDFYQMGAVRPDAITATIADKICASGGRLLVVAGDEAFLTRLDRQLWDRDTGGFLPHALAGGVDDARQPVLLSTSEDAPNLARNLLIADGRWREAALSFDRAFFLFGAEGMEEARLAWKLLSGRAGVERHYWAHDGARWIKQG